MLGVVESAPGPVTAADIGAELDLHHSTVREHLDALVKSGSVVVSTRATGRRGRPALCYSAVTADPHQVLSSYVTLLDAVADTLGEGPEAHETALAIGRRWAERTEAAATPQSVPEADATEELLVGLTPELARLGFAPAATAQTSSCAPARW